MIPTQQPLPTLEDFEQAEKFIRTILGSSLAKSEIKAGTSTINLEQRNEIFCQNAEKAYGIIHRNLQRDKKNYFKTLDPTKFRENLQNVQRCAGKTTQAYLDVMSQLMPQNEFNVVTLHVDTRYSPKKPHTQFTFIPLTKAEKLPCKKNLLTTPTQKPLADIHEIPESDSENSE